MNTPETAPAPSQEQLTLPAVDVAPVLPPANTGVVTPSSVVKQIAAKKKANKKAPKRGLPDTVFQKTLMDLLYALRAEKAVWANMRNGSKNGDKLHDLLLKQPVYAWRKVGTSYYYISKHDGEDTVVAYVLPHDPMVLYRAEMAEYEASLKEGKRGRKLPEPKKPTSRKCDYVWKITNRRGTDDVEGHSANLTEAMVNVQNRTGRFIV